MLNKWNFSEFLYQNLAKPYFFKQDPEDVHDRIVSLGSKIGNSKILRSSTKAFFAYHDTILEQNIKGLHFINPVGLSAGFDKNAQLINIMPSVGFGFMEIGSVTNKPYIGNEKPRLYRLPKSKALIVYYGLKNDGVEIISSRIQNSIKSKAIVGVSVAKTNCIETSSLEGGIEDYYSCLNYLEKQVRPPYYTINISCPNTFGGEPFTTKEKLDLLLKRLSELSIFNRDARPVFVKMPIDVSLAEFDKLLDVCVKYKVSGVVIGNLTKNRNSKAILDNIPTHIKGGISGKPTWDLSNTLISHTYRNYHKELIIIGVGGIFSAEDAYEKILLGASLVQLITGMIYQGPQLAGQINFGLARILKQEGFASVKDAVGAIH